ncbi:MAG: tetratricopeptide repeat protein [Treponema sp.]|nr:tetratricopeptide repeat protein [Treponema sp.]
MKKVFSIAFFSFALLANVSALDFAVRITPHMTFPLEEERDSGFGGVINADLDLFNFITVGLEGGYTSVKEKALDENYNIFLGGASMGLYFYPLSRLYMSANGSFGIHNMSINSASVDGSAGGTYWRGFGELGFRFTPGFVLSATGGYESFMIDGNPLVKTPYAGVSAKINFSTGKKASSGFMTDFEQDSAAYPVYANMYKNVPLGYASVRNMSTAEVRDVHISFRAGKYSAAEKECASYSILNRYKKVQVPIYADFGPEILRYSENGQINGELVISYSFLGKRMVEVQNIVLDVRHRNSFVWVDTAALACFIDSGTPEILEAAKYIAGTEITNLKPGMNSPLQYAAAIMEGLRIAGIVYSEDTLTPYKDFHDGVKVDSIQYPLQTLNLMSGDYDDIGILVCSCLESFGVGTGFIAMDDDFIVLVDTGIVPEKKTNQFLEDGVISDANTTWLGLSMKNFSKGFTAARTAAAKKLIAMQKDKDTPYEIVDVHAAWEYYPPVAFSGYRGSYKNPSKDAVIKAVNEDIRNYINNDLAVLIKRFRAAGDTKRLADSYVRAGMYAEALAEYQKLNTISSMNNMGMVYAAQKNYKAALNMYNKVLAKDPNNKNALSNIKKIKILTGE